MDPIKQLTALIAELPGIGPRQARRLVSYLIRRDNEYLNTMAAALTTLKSSMALCPSCYQFFPRKNGQQLCRICADESRDRGQLLVVSDERDLEQIEKSDIYSGLYFVLGGIVPILTAKPDEVIRLSELRAVVKKRIENSQTPLREIILALNATPDGENTEQYIREQVNALIAGIPGAAEKNIKIAHLGRGISTGTEIEYSDAETLKNALQNRR